MEKIQSKRYEDTREKEITTLQINDSVTLPFAPAVEEIGEGQASETTNGRPTGAVSMCGHS